MITDQDGWQTEAIDLGKKYFLLFLQQYGNQQMTKRLLLLEGGWSSRSAKHYASDTYKRTIRLQPCCISVTVSCDVPLFPGHLHFLVVQGSLVSHTDRGLL